MSICLNPWIEGVIGQTFSGTCCYSPKIFYKSFSGTWDGEDFWNSKETIKFREELLKFGKEKVCKNTKCPLVFKKYDVSSYLNNLCKNIEMINILEKVKKSIELNQSFLNYKPIVLKISGSYKCNASCPMCIIGTKNKNLKELNCKYNYDNIKDFISESFSCVFSGGEFFFFSEEEIKETFKYIDEKRSLITVYTNGSLMTLGKYEKYVNNGPIDKIVLSIDSVDKEMYKLIRGLDLKNVTNNIKEIVLKYPTNKIKNINCIINRASYKGCLDLLKFAHSVGINMVSFAVMDNYNIKGTSYEFLDIFNEYFEDRVYKEFESVIDQSFEFAELNNIKIFGLKEVLEYMLRSKIAKKKK